MPFPSSVSKNFAGEAGPLRTVCEFLHQMETYDNKPCEPHVQQQSLDYARILTFDYVHKHTSDHIKQRSINTCT